MKKVRRLVSLVLAVVMVLAMALQVSADAPGSITINGTDTVPVAGKTFSAYKILDLEMVGEDGYVYTVPEGLEDFYATQFGLSKDSGNFDYQVTEKIRGMQGDEDALFAFATAALAAAKAADIVPVSSTANEGAASVVISNLPLGYYVVEDTGAATPISALILDTTNPAVDVTIKADKPSLEKKIDGNTDTDDSTTGLVDFNNAAVGDKVPYVLSSKVPDMTGYTKYYFVVTDTMSAGLTFNDDVAITIGNKSLVKDTDFTVASIVNGDGTTSVEIVFKNFIQYKANKGDAITITYSATLDKDAVIGVAGNPNEVILTYSNNPNITDNGTEGNPDKPTGSSPTGVTPKDETRTFVTGIEILKVDPEGKRLTGAEFTIKGTKLNQVLVSKQNFTESADGTYWLLTDGSYTSVDPDAEGVDTSKYADTTKKYAMTVSTEVVTVAENVTATATVGQDGVLRFDGLSAGEYEITEIKAPDGYNLLSAPIIVTIKWTAPVTGSTDCTWTATGTLKGENIPVNTVNGSFQITVENSAGTELPSTGGMGTTIFYVVGGIIALGAVVLLITRRRMSAE